jgi:hypothetical protein
MSPHPVRTALAWSTTLTIDAVAVGAGLAVLLLDGLTAGPGCGAGSLLCPTLAQARDRDAWTLTAVAGVLLAVLVVALFRGRLLMALFQLALLVALAVLAHEHLPAAFEQVRSKVPFAAASSPVPGRAGLQEVATESAPLDLPPAAFRGPIRGQ